MPELKVLLDQTFLVEVATAYKLAIYEGREEAKKFLEELDRDFSLIQEKQYWDFYKATAINIAKGLNHIEERYRRRKEHIEDHRKFDEEKLRAIKTKRLDFVDDVTDALTKYGLLGRSAPAAGSWVVAKALESLHVLPKYEWVPEAIAAGAVGISHILLKKYSTDQTTKIEEWYNSEIGKAINVYTDKSRALEESVDEKKRRTYHRGEKKVVHAYTKYFGSLENDKTTSELYDNNAGTGLFF